MSLSKETVLESLKQDHVVVLNVLPEAEFQKLHIEGSRSLPLTQDPGSFAAAVEKQYGKKNFFIIYGSNITSRAAIDASDALLKRGFKAEVYLSGTKGWNEAGFPTEGTDAPKKPTSI
jgi:rhodanese-related sulfurtransferase